MSPITRKVLGYAFAIFFIILGWYVTAKLVDSPALPTPLATVSVLGEYLTRLGPDLLVSTRRVVLGLVIGAIPAIFLALLMARSKVLDYLFAPVLYILYPIPKVVILPVLLVLLGLADAPKVALIALTVFFQVMVAVRDAVRGVPHQAVTSARALGASNPRTLFSVVLPASMPQILTALRLSVGTAIAVLFIAEAIAGSAGLGYFIMESWAMVDYPRMFSGIIAMALLGVVLYVIIDIVERRVSRWR